MMKLSGSKPTLLFDLDGTLVDSVYEHVTSWSSALLSIGVSVPKWKIHRRIGMNGKALLRQLQREPEVGNRPLSVKRLEAKHDVAFRNETAKIRPLPGARELLQFLDKMGIRWAIATAGNRSQTARLMKILKVPNAVVVTGDDVLYAKPSPDVFLEAARRLSTSMEDCIIVGDSVWDMLAAGRKRALAVGILAGGYSRTELEGSGAFRVYADPAEMLLHIEDLGI